MANVVTSASKPMEINSDDKSLTDDEKCVPVCSQHSTGKSYVSSMQKRRLAQLHSTNLCLDPSSTSHHARLVHPGLPPQAIDRFGNPSTLSLVLLARMARQVAMGTECQDGRCFLETDKLRQGRTTFMAASQYNFSREVYKPEEKKYPLDVSIAIGHVGRTSFSVNTTVTFPSGKEMMSVVNQLILIDPATRRPTILPETWREYYGPLCVTKQPLIVPKQPTPEHISTQDLPHCKLTVQWTDTDDQQHTNYTSYIRFAFDGLYPALRKGYLGDALTEEDVKAGASEVKVAYLGESTEGDVLHVTLWRHLDDKPRTVVCSMEKEGGQPVCQVTLTFYEAQGDIS